MLCRNWTGQMSFATYHGDCAGCVKSEWDMNKSNGALAENCKQNKEIDQYFSAHEMNDTRQ
eukprot:245878-Rhodomonas_salina.2